jgi:hypothetical protein
MKTLRVFTLALCIAVAGALANTTVASAAQYGRTLTGELVPRPAISFASSESEAASPRLRESAIGAGWQDRAGRALAGWSGDADHRSFRAINPVAHGWSTVRGQVAVTNPAARAFTFAGDTQIYTAPASIDVTLYNGKFAEAKMDENGNVTELNLVPASPQASIPTTRRWLVRMARRSLRPAAHTTARSFHRFCSLSVRHTVSLRRYQLGDLGTTCQPLVAGDAPAPTQRAARASSVTPAVANGSSICRTGTTYRCDDGAWINMQTACR